ncbi:MAG: hypothetical protein Fur005_11740 [Roseiflexaceae bacterium]
MSNELQLPLTLNYRPSVAEQLEAARRYRSTTRKFVFYRVVSVAAIAATIWALLTPGAQLMAIVWIILALFTWFDPLPLLLVWIGARTGANGPEYSATFDQQGITFDMNGQRIHRNWDRYTKLLETPNLFLLVYGSWSYSIIPRRAIGDGASQSQFATLIGSQIK